MLSTDIGKRALLDALPEAFMNTIWSILPVYRRFQKLEAWEQRSVFCSAFGVDGSRFDRLGQREVLRQIFQGLSGRMREHIADRIDRITELSDEGVAGG